MAALIIDVVEPDGQIKVTYTFWGDNADDLDGDVDAHARQDEFLRRAVEEGRTIEEYDETAEAPEAEESEQEETEEEA